MYVHNRVQRIRQSSHPEQWKYIQTGNNPPDHATRPVSAGQLQSIDWLTWPSFLLKPESSVTDDNHFELVNTTTDVDFHPEVKVLVTGVSEKRFNTKHFKRFSSWHALTKAVALLCHIAQAFHKTLQDPKCHGWHSCKEGLTCADLEGAELTIIKKVQEEMYADEMDCIQKDSHLKMLKPFLDSEDLLRVGGRIKHSNLGTDEIHPILIPGKHHLATLLIRHHHERIKH